MINQSGRLSSENATSFPLGASQTRGLMSKFNIFVLWSVQILRLLAKQTIWISTLGSVEDGIFRKITHWLVIKMSNR